MDLMAMLTLDCGKLRLRPSYKCEGNPSEQGCFNNLPNGHGTKFSRTIDQGLTETAHGEPEQDQPFIRNIPELGIW